MLIKDFILGIFNKLGITGIFIIALFCVIAYQHYVINDERKVIVLLNNKIDEQNTAITTAGIARDSLQVKLDNVEDANDVLTVKTEKLLEKIRNMPIATTCNASMEEVASSAKQNADEWNGVNVK